jgi:hypothetical protein
MLYRGEYGPASASRASSRSWRSVGYRRRSSPPATLWSPSPPRPWRSWKQGTRWRTTPMPPSTRARRRPRRSGPTWSAPGRRSSGSASVRSASARRRPISSRRPHPGGSRGIRRACRAAFWPLQAQRGNVADPAGPKNAAGRSPDDSLQPIGRSWRYPWRRRAAGHCRPTAGPVPWIGPRLTRSRACNQKKTGQ